MYEFPDNRLQIEILTYSASIESITHQDTNPIVNPTKNLEVELKQTEANSLSVFFCVYLTKLSMLFDA